MPIPLGQRGTQDHLAVNNQSHCVFIFAILFCIIMARFHHLVVHLVVYVVGYFWACICSLSSVSVKNHHNCPSFQLCLYYVGSYSRQLAVLYYVQVRTACFSTSLMSQDLMNMIVILTIWLSDKCSQDATAGNNRLQLTSCLLPMPSPPFLFWELHTIPTPSTHCNAHTPMV